jgi:hypothetical protein
MTVRADDIAFRDLVQYSRRARPSDHARDGGAFRVRIAVVEVHHAWRIPFATIRAWHIAELVEQLGMQAPLLTLTLEVS